MVRKYVIDYIGFALIPAVVFVIGWLVSVNAIGYGNHLLDAVAENLQVLRGQGDQIELNQGRSGIEADGVHNARF